ncbi:DarT ssDNA thymidine ADP-ribosyltransferase family protein [uncultured Amnibacterium sp.]|uniref:DarT ssDNA thymidine ADP-ribosyltransferase family protein n=1 Tax=uncultured Amnibacterium sp. TaxID=1631851 RepID=UPI0035CC41E4
MCDLCFPRVVAEPAAAVVGGTTKTVPRARKSTRPAGGRTPTVRGSGAAAKVPPFASRRLYHVTPLTNLESILLDGAIKPIASGIDPDIDIAAPLVRQLRAHRDVGDGRHVDEFVPFAVSPEAERWVELQEGAEEPHWSQAARALGPSDYAVLVAVGRDLGTDLVVADGDAGAAPTRFTVGETAPAIARAAHFDPEFSAVEVLVAQEVPVSSLTLIAVANEPARAKVRRMFQDVDGTAPKVVVHPPWFGA